MNTNVAYDVGPNVNPLQNRETQHVNIILQCLYRFFEQPNMKGNHSLKKTRKRYIKWNMLLNACKIYKNYMN